MINFICFLCQLYKGKINYIYMKEINYFFVISVKMICQCENYFDVEVYIIKIQYNIFIYSHPYLICSLINKYSLYHSEINVKKIKFIAH